MKADDLPRMEKRYQIVVDDSYRGIEDQVNALMDQGWRPLGGIVSGSSASPRPRWLQSLVRDTTNKTSIARSHTETHG